MSQDLNAQNSGIKAVNSGPLVIRTYNDQSGNNTYMVGPYDKAISSNCILTTSTGGLLVPTSTVQVSSINVALLVMGNATFSTLTGSTLNTANLANSSIITAALTTTQLSASSATYTEGFYSTLRGSTLSTNTLVVTSSLTVSTISSLNSWSNFLVNNSTITGSTLSANTLVVTSSLTVSTISSLNSWSNFLVNNSTITGSTISGRLVAYSTLVGSTISTNTIAVTSTLTGSTLIMNGPITCTGITYGYTTLSLPSATQIGYTISATIAGTSGATGSNFAPLIVTTGVWLVTFLVTFTGMNTYPNSVITIVGGPATSYPILTTVTANTGVGMGTYIYNNTTNAPFTLGLSVVTASSQITTLSSYYTATRIA